MKNLVISITLATLAAPAFAQNPPALKDNKDKVSYSIGLDIGTTFKKQKMEISSDALVAGLKDGMSGKAGFESGRSAPGDDGVFKRHERENSSGYQRGSGKEQ